MTAALVVAGSVISSNAQSLDRGEIHGTVRDESGAVIFAVSITLQEVSTGFERSVATNHVGQYAAVLPIGSYRVQAALPGFATVQTSVQRLGVGEALLLNLVMPVAAVFRSIEVTARGRNASAAGFGLGIAADAIETLPLNVRDYRTFALLAPTAGGITGTRGAFRVAGQPGDHLSLQVDGTDFTNNFFGEFLGSLETRNVTLPLEAVQEFQVNVGGFAPEFGRSAGGLVNVATKSGTNTIHGTGAYFLRADTLAGRDAFGNSPAGLLRHQFAGSLGGPIVKNRIFYFLAADAQRQRTPITVRFGRDVRGTSVPELGIGSLHTLEGSYPRDEHTTAFFGKVDYTIDSEHRISTRVNFSRNDGTNIAGGSLILARSTDNLERFTDQALSIVQSFSGSLGRRLFAESRVQFASELRPRHAQGDGPQVTISDTGTFGGSQVLPATQDMYRYQALTDLHYASGRQAFKFGVDYNAFNMRNNSFALARRGAYTFPTLERFIARQPSLYGQNFGLGGVTADEAALLESFWQTELAWYVQGQFRSTSSRLSISAGLRYDAQFNPQPLSGTAGVLVPVGRPRRVDHIVQLDFAPVPQTIPNDTNNWAPRLDAAYDWSGVGRTFVKGAIGIYYARTPMIYFPIAGSGLTNSTIFAPPAAFGVTFPDVLPSTIPAGSSLLRLIPPPSIHYVDPGFQNPRVLNMTASITHHATSDVTLELGTLFSDSRHLRIGGFRSTFWDRNLKAPTVVDEFGRGRNVLAPGRPDTTIGQANALTSFGHGRYRALIVSVRRALNRGWQFSGTYTFSRSEGNGSTERDTEAVFGPSDPFNIESDYGINELDQRHTFKSYLSVGLPAHVTLGSIWTAGSGLAFPVYSPIDVNSDGITNAGLHPDRPIHDGVLMPRFPFHQPSWFMWDLRATKGIGSQHGRRYEVAVDVFNVLASKNTFSDPRTNAVLGQVNFRQRNRTLGPRMAQLGFRMTF